jgi:hypothetical protein
MIFGDAGPAFQQLSEHSPIEDFADLVAKIAGCAAHGASDQRCRERSGSSGPDGYRRGSGAKTKAPASGRNIGADPM